MLRKETNEYDAASRITERYEGPATGGVTTTFGYDDVGQLTAESATGYSATYTYDANGNRATKVLGGVTETYTVDDADKLTSVTWSTGGNNYAKEYAYHYSGRPTSITYKTNGGTTATETMTWDKESRMLTNSLANATYAYNGFDARVSKTVGATTTTFKRAGADPVSPVVSDLLGGNTTNYLPGISSRVGSTSTFNHSGIKNGILQTSAAQSNTATKRYDAFGNELATSGTWQTRFDYGGGFGYQRDDESGYKLLGHRYYDKSTGRFLKRDPIKDGRNWYSYCDGDPVGREDSTGKQSIVAAPNPLDHVNRVIDGIRRQVSEFFYGSEHVDPEGYKVVVGGVLTPNLYNPPKNAMTLTGATHLRSLLEWKLYLADPYWRNHEHHHIWQEKQMGTGLYLAEILAEYAQTMSHDKAPMEIEAENHSGDPTRKWQDPWEGWR